MTQSRSEGGGAENPARGWRSERKVRPVDYTELMLSGSVQAGNSWPHLGHKTWGVMVVIAVQRWPRATESKGLRVCA